MIATEDVEFPPRMVALRIKWARMPGKVNRRWRRNELNLSAYGSIAILPAGLGQMLRRTSHYGQRGVYLAASGDLSLRVTLGLLLKRVRHGLHDTPRVPLIQAIQCLHIIFTQLESIDISIGYNPLRSITLRQRHPALLQTVSYQHLGGGFVVLLCQVEQCAVVCLVISHQR
jgi:hypothetical protein